MTTVLDLIAALDPVAWHSLQEESRRWLGLDGDQLRCTLRNLERLGHVQRHQGRWSCHLPACVGPGPTGQVLVLGHPGARPVIERLTGRSIQANGDLCWLMDAPASALRQLPGHGIRWITMNDLEEALTTAGIPDPEALPPWPSGIEIQAGWRCDRPGALDDRWQDDARGCQLLRGQDPITDEMVWGWRMIDGDRQLDHLAWFLAACRLAHDSGHPIIAILRDGVLHLDPPAQDWRQVLLLHGATPADSGWRVPSNTLPTVRRLLSTNLLLNIEG